MRLRATTHGPVEVTFHVNPMCLQSRNHLVSNRCTDPDPKLRRPGLAHLAGFNEDLSSTAPSTHKQGTLALSFGTRMGPELTAETFH